MLSSLLLATSLLCPPSDCVAPSAEVPVVSLAAVNTPRPIDLAICLDTSGSMNGLIDSARAKLWDIVNDLALAQPRPELRVALLTFGNNGHVAENGWVKVDVDFTDDLDLVSERLFALTINGGEEYVARVVDAATRSLKWSDQKDALQMIIVAGNESAEQDPLLPFRDALKRAIERGIVVNSIYCGMPSDSLAPAWREVATLADGHFASIDQSLGATAIATPFDEELTSLSSAINATYLPFGAAGAWSASNQMRQDANAEGLNEAAAAQRCVTKGSELYSCSGWDLVDASKGETFKLEEVKDEHLPEAMRSMTLEERNAHITAAAATRSELQKSIVELGEKRRAFVVVEEQKQASEGGKSFDAAIRTAIRAQASGKGFIWPEIATR